MYTLLHTRPYRILFYSGNTDAVIPTRGSRLWITNLGWEVRDKWRPYYYQG